MNKGKSYGFTLLELLVVVSIMVILMSLLLPALKSARETGNQIKCISNLKQLGMASIAYSGDNNDYLPASGGWWWCAEDNPFSMYYLNNRQILICSSLKTRTFPDAAYSSWYGVNYSSIWILSSSNYGSKKISSVKNPSGMLLFCCGHRQITSTGYGETSGRLIYAHRNGVNLLFLDGNARLQRRSVPDAFWY